MFASLWFVNDRRSQFHSAPRHNEEFHRIREKKKENSKFKDERACLDLKKKRKEKIVISDFKFYLFQVLKNKSSRVSWPKAPLPAPEEFGEGGVRGDGGGSTPARHESTSTNRNGPGVGPRGDPGRDPGRALAFPGASAARPAEWPRAQRLERETRAPGPPEARLVPPVHATSVHVRSEVG